MKEINNFELPDGSNFFCQLKSSLSVKEVVNEFSKNGWHWRMSSFEDYEIRAEWAEIIISNTDPIVMSGPIANSIENLQSILLILNNVKIAYKGELYGSEEELLSEFKSENW